jgi:hypothetical protein
MTTTVPFPQTRRAVNWIGWTSLALIVVWYLFDLTRTLAYSISQWGILGEGWRCRSNRAEYHPHPRFLDYNALSRWVGSLYRLQSARTPAPSRLSPAAPLHWS